MPWPSYGSIRAREHLATMLQQVTVSDASGAGIRWLPASPPVTCYMKLEGIRLDDNLRAGQDISEVWKFAWARGPKDGGPTSGLIATSRFQIDTGQQFIIKAIDDVEDRGVLLKLSCLGLGPNV